MAKTLIDILLSIQREKEKYFKNYKFYSKRIKKEAKKILGKEIKVLVFGSIIKNEWGAGSDIDILIISDKLPEDIEKRGKIKTRIKSKISLFSPFQIHLATEKEFKTWYKNFIKDDYIEI